MSSGSEIVAFAIDDIILPLGYDATNPTHVSAMETHRAKLHDFLVTSGFAPKTGGHKESASANTYRDDTLLVNFAKALMAKGLVDASGCAVSLYDACDFASWLYHGFKWLNAAVCIAYATGKHAPVMGFVKKIVDGAEVIVHITKVGKVAKESTMDSKYTNVDWSAWSGPQMITPLELLKSVHVTSHKKALYHFFNPKPVKGENPKSGLTGGGALEKTGATISDVVTAAFESKPKPKPKFGKGKKPKPVNGGAGGA
jgi:hypothetical protein